MGENLLEIFSWNMSTSSHENMKKNYRLHYGIKWWILAESQQMLSKSVIPWKDRFIVLSPLLT